MTREMYDSSTLTDIPATAQMAAAYVNGRFGVADQDFLSRFSKVPRVLIDVDGSAPNKASVRDWENGDKGGSLEQWVKDCNAQFGHGTATIYCNRSTIQEVRNLTASQILAKDYWLWVATLDGTLYQAAPGVVACQRDGVTQTGRHYDRSIVFADWWHPSTAPKPAAPPASVRRGLLTLPPGAWLPTVEVTDGTWHVKSTDHGATWQPTARGPI